jgi:tRNA dimethylallyltransferase
VKVIIISGATATGKTDLSIKMAHQFGGEIINFDSLLLYKELNIGTAKPTKLERGEIPHHMIDVTSISNPLNAADYMRKALPIIESILGDYKMPILVGGSGFYLQALLNGMYESQTSPQEVLERSRSLFDHEGIEPFRNILKQNDLASYERYHENDHYRIRRAVEHFWTTGTPLSEKRKKKDQENEDFQASNIHGWQTLHLYLKIPKEDHWQIINKRTERMISDGLIDEVSNLLKNGFSGLEKPLKSIGYKEAMDLIRGDLISVEDCKEKISVSTRQLAKAQKTWFNRIQDKKTFNPLLDHQDIVQTIEDFLQKSK